MVFYYIEVITKNDKGNEKNEQSIEIRKFLLFNEEWCVDVNWKESGRRRDTVQIYVKTSGFEANVGCRRL